MPVMSEALAGDALDDFLQKIAEETQAASAPILDNELLEIARKTGDHMIPVNLDAEQTEEDQGAGISSERRFVRLCLLTVLLGVPVTILSANAILDIGEKVRVTFWKHYEDPAQIFKNMIRMPLSRLSRPAVVWEKGKDDEDIVRALDYEGMHIETLRAGKTTDIRRLPFPKENSACTLVDDGCVIVDAAGKVLHFTNEQSLPVEENGHLLPLNLKEPAGEHLFTAACTKELIFNGRTALAIPSTGRPSGNPNSISTIYTIGVWRQNYLNAWEQAESLETQIIALGLSPNGREIAVAEEDIDTEKDANGRERSAWYLRRRACEAGQELLQSRHIDVRQHGLPFSIQYNKNGTRLAMSFKDRVMILDAATLETKAERSISEILRNYLKENEVDAVREQLQENPHDGIRNVRFSDNDQQLDVHFNEKRMGNAGMLTAASVMRLNAETLEPIP